MTSYIIRRLVQALVVVAAIVTITFLLTRLSGDPVVLYLDNEDLARPEIVEAARRRFGLDEPIIVQYGKFVVSAIQGEFGNSLRHNQPAMTLVLRRLPATAQLAIASLTLALIVSIPGGMWAAIKEHGQQRLAAAPVMMGTLLGQSTPSFWLGIMLILFFGVRLQWLPISGRGTLQHLVMPAFSLAVAPAAYFARLTRSSLLEVLNQEYISFARSKGTPESRVLGRHALRNAAVPLVTAAGLSFGRLMTGAVVIETVFAWPGMGQLAVQSVFNRDFPVAQATVFVGGLLFVSINMLMDFVYVVIDPRIRYR